MANEKVTVKKETGSNLTPIIIIGAIFLATIVGIYMISQSGGNDANNSATNANSTANGNKTQAQDQPVSGYATAPSGASPANMKGLASSPVVVEEFADFECPTCAVVHPKMKELMAKYGNRANFVFRNYPLTTIHKKAYDAAVAVEAAGLQGKFWEMQNLLFNNQSNWINSQNHKQDFAGYAKTLGMDVEKFNNDLLAMNTKMRVDADMKRGRALNITSTPSVLINGKLVPFAQMEVEGMGKLIDAELEKFNPKKESETKPAGGSSDKKDETSDKADKKEEVPEK